VALNSII